MVGRPGRSKGCFNCQKRKKGCDLGRPFCGQCLKTKQHCKGYSSSLKVVAYVPPSTGAVVQKLQDSAIETKVIESFWEKYLPTWSDKYQQDEGSRNWVTVIRDRCSANSCIKYGVLALTLSRNGQLSGDRRLVQSGSKYYGSCLRTIASTMQPKRLLSDGVLASCLLASCLLLGLYEILCTPASPGFNWLNHQLGIGQLIQVRGPHAYTAGDSYRLFVSARLSIIFAAIVSRKSTFLSLPEWLSIPWSIFPKTPYDKLVDICADIAGLLETCDRTNLKSRDPGEWKLLLDLCWHLDSLLQNWHQDFHEHYGTFDKSTGPLTPLCEATPEQAHALSVYWTACTFLYGTMRVAWQQTGSPVYLLPPRTDPEQYAILISQSLPYFMLPTAGEESLINYSIAIAAALYYLGLIGEISGEHGQRIISVFDCSKTVSSSIGHRIGRFLNTIKNDPTGLNIQVPGQGAATITETTQIWWGGGKEKIVLCLV